MRRRLIVVLLSLAAIVPLAVATARAQDKFRLKPGARGKICLQCHTAFEEGLKLPFVHTPVKEGACSDCHNPHTSSHGKLLAAEPEEICSNCHSGLIPEEPASVHPPVAAGRCIECHDPHASQNKNNLRAGGEALCGTCHGDIVAHASGSRFKHSPVEKGCLSCHDPHASEAGGSLLKKDVPALCLGCHRSEQPAFAAAHRNYPVAEARCTSCHDPHGSDNAGILWADVHPPLANRMCNQCHVDPSSPDPLETKRQGFEVCRGCHADVVNGIVTSNRVHWPAIDGTGCLNCHNPHAAKESSLLREPVKPLCGSCHQATLGNLDKAAVKHPPAEEGECITCHSPHASDTGFLLAAPNVIEMCGTCHDWQQHSTHPIGEKVTDPRNKNLTLSCMSCHEPHASPFKSFTHLNPDADLCVQCHAGKGR